MKRHSTIIFSTAVLGITLMTITAPKVAAQSIDASPSSMQNQRQNSDTLQAQIVQDQQNLKQEVQNIKKEVKLQFTRLINAEVKSITNNVLTVEKDDKSYDVTTTNSTKLRRHFWGKSDLDEFSVGDKINVWGRFTNEAKTKVSAQFIRNLSIMKRHGVFFGVVLSKTTNGFVLESATRGNQNVILEATTEVVTRQDKDMTVNDITVGDKVRVKGMWDKTLNTVTDVTEVKDFSQPQKSSTPKATPTP